MADERMMLMAGQVASLLPEPPASHDAFGYVAWEELVLTAAQWLRAYLPDVALQGPVRRSRLSFSPETGRLATGSLTALATLLAHEVDTASCEALLLQATKSWQSDSRTTVPARA
ncbi:hypothetical protein ACFTWF_14775 [Rhodococcus sp. NPDC056960]|uniref:hypothetical protein n=1 Tax=Rhodococcus sp. NPDC056960 TaxID=3345982 RepID=UPI0036373401